MCVRTHVCILFMGMSLGCQRRERAPSGGWGETKSFCLACPGKEVGKSQML